MRKKAKTFGGRDYHEVRKIMRKREIVIQKVKEGQGGEKQ